MRHTENTTLHDLAAGLQAWPDAKRWAEPYLERLEEEMRREGGEKESADGRVSIV